MCWGNAQRGQEQRPREQERLIFLIPRRCNLECGSFLWGSRAICYSWVSYGAPSCAIQRLGGLIIKLHHIQTLASSLVRRGQ